MSTAVPKKSAIFPDLRSRLGRRIRADLTRLREKVRKELGCVLMLF